MSNFPLYLASVRPIYAVVNCPQLVGIVSLIVAFEKFSVKPDQSNEKKMGLIVEICITLVQEISLKESQPLSSF